MDLDEVLQTVLEHHKRATEAKRLRGPVAEGIEAEEWEDETDDVMADKVSYTSTPHEVATSAQQLLGSGPHQKDLIFSYGRQACVW